MRIYILVEVFQLIVSGVHVTNKVEKAKTRFKEYTGVDYNSMQEALRKDPDMKPEELLGDFDQSKIFEFDFFPEE